MHWGYDLAGYIMNVAKTPTTIVMIDNIELGIRAEYIDVLITDLSSLVAEFFPTGKPIILLSNSDKVSSFGKELLKGIYIIYTKDELEKIEGVALATIAGGLEREIIVEVDQGRLMAQKVPLLSVARAIADANLNYPAGTIKESFYEASDCRISN